MRGSVHPPTLINTASWNEHGDFGTKLLHDHIGFLLDRYTTKIISVTMTKGYNRESSYSYEWQDAGSDNEKWSCCNDSQTLFILLYIAFAALAVITWNTLLSKPIRLMAVFVHEWSHAIACWMTCGEVRSIEVYENEGGVTTFKGGCRSIIIPAGYVGCSFYAMIFVIMSGGRLTAAAACLFFTLSMFLALCYSPNQLLVILCLGYSLINIAVCMIEFYLYSPILQFLILYYGVTIGIFAIADIHEDTVMREVEGSDAHACAEEACHSCSPRCIGIQWAILAIVFQLIGIWMAMVQMSAECSNLGWFECINLSVDTDNFNLFERNWEFEGFWEQAQQTVAQMRGGGTTSSWNSGY